jgi:hypothetical protein
MKLLSSKQELNDCLFDIIEKSQNVLKIVSPFVKFSDIIQGHSVWWDVLVELLNKKESIIEIYTKTKFVEKISKKIKINENNIIPIHNLHAKIYINDDTALLSSMNLMYSSFNHSIDFGIVTENETEYREVLDYCNKHIFVHNTKSIREYFITKNIEAKFKGYFKEYYEFVLKKNDNTYLECKFRKYNSQNIRPVFYFSVMKNGKKYISENIFFNWKKDIVKIRWSEDKEMFYFTLEENECPNTLIPVDVFKEKILDILVNIVNYIDREV